ncbi:MAG: oxaloacetate decarboxylase [Ruminococcus sp.]|nr:oxaloacetate decarboxylase [Ruminococcus sp.]
MKKWLAVIPAICIVVGIIWKIKEFTAVSIIGGADGPTAIFVAGSLGGSFWITFIIVVILVLLAALLIWKLKKK